ncbi:MAG TPA: SUMF1/EgtB/PvdO family nonheme iron enzyme [Thermoflexales bacterium]|nr:SUMF1/EgtB/PvdO family nonheme iron enzyme [Thermoflexales bacterium]HQY23896.1 SUMF1/EgtB/PvdO family nonheme iron enzyme [Thermoflexales bacterium]HRA53795.1 SUMF1/EgtB/PvdO family nonheme iron enzyme [Thermoflexales bacterium]
MKRNLLAVAACLLGACAAPALPATTPSIDTGVNPEAWVSIPAGTFFSGQHAEPALISHDYKMMATLVTNAQYARYLNDALAAGRVKLDGNRVVGYYAGDPFSGAKHEEVIAAGDWPHFTINAPGSRITWSAGAASIPIFAANPGFENHPVTLVTWFGARAYCEAQGGRLPTEAEWEKAARGTDTRAYPWGDTIERNAANFYDSRDPFEQASGKAGDTTPVGFYSGKTYSGYTTLDGQSPYGLHDMAGNAWQWMADVYEGQHYRYLRGGSRLDYGYNLRLWTRNNVNPEHAGLAIGFRCAR